MSGSEIVSVLVMWAFWAVPLVTIRDHLRVTETWLLEVVSLLNVASLTTWLSRWSREKQARRGVRATPGNRWDAISAVLLGLGAALSAFSTDRLTPWIGGLSLMGFVLVLVGLRRRIRRALAPTPAQVTETAFE